MLACCIETETAQRQERVWSCFYTSAIGVLRWGAHVFYLKLLAECGDVDESNKAYKTVSLIFS